MKIKICGLRNLEDVYAVNEAMPDYIGFIFVKSSKRYITPDCAAHIYDRLNKEILKVGVFVNANIDTIASIMRKNIIDIIQLHGDEDNDYIKNLRSKTKAKIIKAVSVNSPEDLVGIYNIKSDYILLDNGKGGTGKTFDWSLFPKDMHHKIFLAGGISFENIDAAVSLSPYCIDVSSGVETDGIKDRKKIIKIVKICKGGNLPPGKGNK
ncbi:MAG: phosphoribosylanthranilate isomerase [Oscillospiraceae bacterium]|nr:phosphoribosylanthranilate isomerase [Oscillospiraceae bacterium]